ncbi:hypothetical protein BTN49_0739 [Candidatus Enterovibrio escicola]|uniref:Mobile element protein n=1 Tax=Candidatus Enterovibrio escicola TaxID=1927127 RepID=A0A2A5T6Q1_9GAMM|nr:hypothetical protein BTN49_0739 [Candidatus Enterovibrio escacola]
MLGVGAGLFSHLQCKMMRVYTVKIIWDMHFNFYLKSSFIAPLTGMLKQDGIEFTVELVNWHICA